VAARNGIKEPSLGELTHSILRNCHYLSPILHAMAFFLGTCKGECDKNQAFLPSLSLLPGFATPVRRRHALNCLYLTCNINDRRVGHTKSGLFRGSRKVLHVICTRWQIVNIYDGSCVSTTGQGWCSLRGWAPRYETFQDLYSSAELGLSEGASRDSSQLDYRASQIRKAVSNFLAQPSPRPFHKKSKIGSRVPACTSDSIYAL
jgi:hypothetical protein